MESYQILTGVAALLIVAAVAMAVQPSIAYDLTTALPVQLQDTEFPSPADRVSLRDIRVNSNEVAVQIPGAVLYAIADTNSMDPTLDKESTIVAVKPLQESDLIVGDIVIYRAGSALIIHRIVEIGEDSDGKYFVPKGDNNDIADGKIRFSQIEAVVIGILY